MSKEKYNLEYIFDKVSRNMLWPRIATPAGLSEWFADEVNESTDKTYSFVWNKHPAEAEVIGSNPNTYIRFRWLEDEDPDIFFEFRLHRNELTGGTVLEIIDFAESGEREDGISLWDSQVSTLRRSLGLL